MQHHIENLPWWAKLLFIVGGALMSAFSGLFPMWLQAAGLYTGILLALLGAGASIWHWANAWREHRGKPRLKVEAGHLIGLGLIGIIVFAAVALAGVILSNQSAPAAPSPIKEQPPQKSVYLKDAYVYGGSVSPPLSPRFSAKFLRNGQRGRLYIDDSWFVSGLGTATWVQRNRIFLAEINDFVVEQAINIPILTSFEQDGRKLWRWGQDAEQPHSILSPQVWHRCRVVFISDDAPPENFYFIIGNDPLPDGSPFVISSHHFDFIKEWEAEGEKQK